MILLIAHLSRHILPLIGEGAAAILFIYFDRQHFSVIKYYILRS